MKLLASLASIALAGLGIAMVAAGDASGWLVAGFFGLCLLVVVLEPRLARRRQPCGHRVLITDEAIACERPQGKRESIRWDEVSRIWYVTTADGPWLPDEWILLEGEQGGCSFPTEAQGYDRFWDELERRFPGFDYRPLIGGGTDLAKHLCWERPPRAAG